MVRQYYMTDLPPGGKYLLCHDCEPTGALIKATLMNSATGLGNLEPPDDLQGWGIVDLRRTLAFQDRTRTLWVADVRNEDGVDTQEFRTFPLEVARGTRDLRITLVWTEPPGQPNAPDPKVNDLDLVVRDANHVTHLGNQAVDGSRDSNNNVEQVRITNPVHGGWEIRVDATEVHVADGAQGFAIVATGENPHGVAVEYRVVPSTKSNRKLKRRWFETRFLASGGGDTNPLLLDDEAGSDAFGRWGVVANETYTKFRPPPDTYRWDRMFDVRGAFGIGGTQYTDAGAASRLGWSAGFSVEGAPWRISSTNKLAKGRGAFALSGKEIWSFGALYRYSDLRVGSAPFLRSHRVVPAAALTLNRARDCDLSQVVLFGSYDWLDDRSVVSDTELDQDGTFAAIGGQFSWIQTPKQEWVCMGSGIFRQPVVYDHVTARAAAQYGQQDADGTEFNRDVIALSADTSVPVWRKNGATRLLFDGHLEYDRADHSNTSIFEPLTRADNLWYADLGLTWLIMRQSNSAEESPPPPRYTDLRLRLGVSHIDRSSNVSGLDFKRTAYGLTFDIIFGSRRQGTEWNNVDKHDTDSPGSTLTGGSGPKLPEILTELP